MQGLFSYICLAWHIYNPELGPSSMPTLVFGNKELGKVYDTMKYKRTAFNKIADIKERASTGGHPSNKEGTLSWAFVLAKATEGEIVV